MFVGWFEPWLVWRAAKAVDAAPGVSGRETKGFVAAVMIAFVASACGGGGTEPPGMGEVREPEKLEASRDREDRVSLTWILAGRSMAEAQIVERDGVAIAQLPGDAVSFDDSSAEAGGWEAPTGLGAEARGDSIVLAWTASTRRDGKEHAYRVVADHGARGKAASAPASGRRVAPATGRYRVVRDGAAVVEVDDVAWQDDGATPGGLTSAGLSGTGEAEAVHLAWRTPTGFPGPTHTYTVVPITSVGEGPASAMVQAARLAPGIGGWEIRRDGVAIASLPGTATSFDDAGAAPGFVESPEVAVTPRPDGVEISWPIPSTHFGTLHGYELVAIGVSTSWKVEARRAAPTVDGFRIESDAFEAVDLPATEGAFFDDSAEAGTIGAPSGLTALPGASGTAHLEWQTPSSQPGRQRVYRVGTRTSAGVDVWSEPVMAGRAAPDVDAYEVQRDGGPWMTAGNATFYDDADGPAATITATASLIADRALGFVELRLDGEPVVGTPPAVAYRVRARAGADVGPASEPVLAVREVGGALQVQWQRSAGDADADYTDVPDAVFRSSVDLDASTTEHRYYRAVLRADGAEGFSAPVRGKARGYSSLAMGWNTTCGLDPDGRAACWGGNLAPLIPADLAFSKLSVGGSHACGLRASDGKMLCWGDDADGQAPPGPSAEPYLDVATGYEHTCYLEGSGGLRCIGDSGKGPVWSAGPYVAVAAGFSQTCAIEAAGGIRCWNQEGTPPTGTFTAITVGDRFACALRIDGRRLCWGSNHNGGAPPGPSDETFSAIRAGFHHSCGLLDTGSLRCFGQPVGPEPPAGPTANTWIDLGVRGDLTCALGEDGKVLCWGANHAGNVPTPPVTGAFTSLATSGLFTCGLRALDGKRLCWGWDTWSDATSGPSADPFLAITTGAAHGCGLREDHSVVCWGLNSESQAPPGPSTDRFDAITAGRHHTCGLRMDGKVVCWGLNTRGQAAAPTAHSFTSVDAGSGDHTCGVRVDGNVACWGQNDWVQAPPWLGSSTFLSVSLGTLHSCGIRHDSKLVCWGRDRSGEAPSSPPFGTFQSAALGEAHTCGLRTDGTVNCFGWNYYGQLDAPPTEVFRSLAAANNHTCGINSEGKVICWGTNVYGQAPPPGALP